MRLRFLIVLLSAASVVASVSGCGSGSSAWVTITPQYGTVQAGQALAFAADVHGLTDTTVTWSADAGAIDAGGTYTAPPVPGPYRITAVANGDARVKQTVTVTVTQAPQTGVRTFSAPRYIPGSRLTVTISVIPDASAGVYAVEETFPPLWTISNVSHGGLVDAANGKVKWFFTDSLARTLTFDATPPAGESGDRTFVGTLVVDANPPISIIGKATIGP